MWRPHVLTWTGLGIEYVDAGRRTFNTNQDGGSAIVSYFDKATPLVSWRRASVNNVLALCTILDVYEVLLNQ